MTDWASGRWKEAQCRRGECGTRASRSGPGRGCTQTVWSSFLRLAASPALGQDLRPLHHTICEAIKCSGRGLTAPAGMFRQQWPGPPGSQRYLCSLLPRQKWAGDKALSPHTGTVRAREIMQRPHIPVQRRGLRPRKAPCKGLLLSHARWRRGCRPASCPVPPGCWWQSTPAF